MVRTCATAYIFPRQAANRAPLSTARLWRLVIRTGAYRDQSRLDEALAEEQRDTSRTYWPTRHGWQTGGWLKACL